MNNTIAQIDFKQPIDPIIQPVSEAIQSSPRRLRVTWTSNHPDATSGYSQQTQDIQRKFLESGWNTTNFSLINMFGQVGFIQQDRYGITNYPSLAHPTGSDAMMHHGNHFQADVSFGLFDVWAMNPEDVKQVRRWIPWVPVDSDPIQPGLLQNLRFANRIIAMSKFGQKTLQNNGFASVYIPHHVNTKLFVPMDKQQAKVSFGLPPDAFVFGMIAANKDGLPRKSFGHVLEAFAKFLQKYPNSFLYMHTNPDQMGGYPIKLHAGQLGILPRVLFPEPYKWQFEIRKEHMPNIYALFDVLLSPSSTEGFAIPIIEAMSCGIPAIVTDYTAMPEHIIDGETGYIVKVGCSHLMPNGQYMRFPDTEDLYQKMLRIKGMKLDIMGKAARNHTIIQYDLDTIWQDKWLPFLGKLEQEIYPEQLTKPS